MEIKSMFKMGTSDSVPINLKFGIQIFGVILLLLLWIGFTESGIVPMSIFPSPLKVIGSFKDLLGKPDYLIYNSGYSLYLNFIGYFKAIILVIPLGFILGLIPAVRIMFEKYIDAMRFIPLTAIVGLFIAWFGIYDTMKINFLALGIIVYLLPMMVQRVSETEQVYVDTVWTLGGNIWHLFRYVYFPSAMSKVFNDIRVIVATSWTYIIIAEIINNTGGIGALAHLCSRQQRIDKVFACLLVIVLIGFVQDKLFKMLDKLLFPYKYTMEAK